MITTSKTVSPSYTVSIEGYPPSVRRALTLTSAPTYLCPDLLRYEQIGAADRWRGRVVRAFFSLLLMWRTP